MISLAGILELINNGVSIVGIKNLIEVEIKNARDVTVTLSDAGSVTPAALRMRKMREKARKSAEIAPVTPTVTVTSRGVTSDITLSSSKDVLKVKSKEEKRNVGKRNSYAKQFLAFWKAYPTDSGMSKAEAHKVWQKMSQEDCDYAIGAIPAFKAWVAKQGKDYRTVHAVRYLSQSRFEGFVRSAEIVASQASSVPVQQGTPAWAAWAKAKGKESPVTDIRTSEGLIRGWYFPTEFPEIVAPLEVKGRSL